MADWLPHALTTIDAWLSHQMRTSEQPGCSVAVTHGPDLVLERAYGLAWRSLHSTSGEACYGLGVASEPIEEYNTFGHTGGFFGCCSRTISVPELRLTLSVLMNATDGPASEWAAALIQILRRHEKMGPPEASVADWRGRWWNPWGAIDLIPLGDVVLLTSPDSLTPFTDAPEITVSSSEAGRITAANGFGSFGEPVLRVLAEDGKQVRLWLAGEEYLPEAALIARTREAG